MLLLRHRFRPLIGVNFCKRESKSYYRGCKLVSVPLSGLTSVNFEGGADYAFDYNGVSVPLSGLTSVNMVQYLSYTIGLVRGFRPLIGVNFCKLYICWSKYESGYVEFPSPYRG